MTNDPRAPYDDVHLQAARDYLLERWQPESDRTTVELTAENHVLEIGYPGDDQLKRWLPHYRDRSWLITISGRTYSPFFSARMRSVLAEIGLNLGVHCGSAVLKIADCVLENYDGMG